MLQFRHFVKYSKHTPFSFFPFLFQRLVEAAEDAYLKHEFDADLQVINICFFNIYHEYAVKVYAVPHVN